jgi:hypothetical protein
MYRQYTELTMRKVITHTAITVLETTPELKAKAKAIAAARGISLNGYLRLLIAQADSTQNQQT